MFDAVVFDLDGVLIDSERIYLTAWRQVAEELDCQEIVAAYVDVVGLPYDQVEPIVHANLKGKVTMERFREAIGAAVARLVVDGYPLKTGVFEILQFLQDRGIPRAVATSSTTSVPVKLHDTGLDRYFQHVVTRDEVAHGKPHPDVYLAAAERLGVAPAKCVAVEDSEPGLRAALAAGMVVTHVPDLIEISAEITGNCRIVCPDLLVLRDWLAAQLEEG
ncbi:MAG: HAD family phosphatase [Rhodospirillaceae bacterium]|jgi:HAD superfamily hydrolase (TIGR01509 family)|nr:HAD family phosphatase [Rhodospirillaceae bacterium]MBT5894512.1 HAD family phosphatase [Rhodospirillaceae bacterium]MBT6429338.1 HAD family phosphatase [Rhodospirillaceae bacterium]MBT7760492.1 HAD family phosphatase [Rhodospirillaceae bacterium]